MFRIIARFEDGNQMKVFVSWSGNISRTVAGILHQYIPVIIQSADVFFSQEDIEKGVNWDNVLQDELANSFYGIVCLTPQNINAPWINFEAGAIAKSLDSRVSSLLIGVKPSDINGPLTRFQATGVNKDDFFKLIKGINSNIEHPLDSDLLKRSFDASWPKIEEGLKDAEKATLEVRSNIGAYIPSEPNPQEIILQTVRDIASQISSPENLIPPSYIASIVSQIHQRESTIARNPYYVGRASSYESDLLHFTISSMSPILNTLIKVDPQAKRVSMSISKLIMPIQEMLSLFSSIDIEAVPQELRSDLDRMLQMIRIILVKFDR